MIYVIVISFNFQAVTFLFFSLASAIFGGALTVIYSILIVFHGVDEWGNPVLEESRNYDAKITILGMILSLGMIECCIGCVAHVSVYRMLMICCFSSPTPQVSPIYNYPFRVSTTQYFLSKKSIWIFRVINFLLKKFCYLSLLRGK